MPYKKGFKLIFTLSFLFFSTPQLNLWQNTRLSNPPPIRSSFSVSSSAVFRYYKHFPVKRFLTWHFPFQQRCFSFNNRASRLLVYRLQLHVCYLTPCYLFPLPYFAHPTIPDLSLTHVSTLLFITMSISFFFPSLFNLSLLGYSLSS